jgi:lactate oxidase
MIESRRNVLLTMAGAFAAMIPAARLAMAQSVGKSGDAAAEGAAQGPNFALRIINFDRIEAQARDLMTPSAYAYVVGGVGGEETLRANLSAFSRVLLRPKRLLGFDEVDVDVRLKLLGQQLPFPIICAPMGAQGFAHPQADLATATGTGALNALYTASSAANQPLEAIAKATRGPKWFQLYFNQDREVNRRLLTRAREAGYSAIVFTVDSLGPGDSDGYLRAGSPTPEGFTFGNFDPKYGGSGSLKNRAMKLSYDDIRLVREDSGLPVIVKGILRGDDAIKAINAGAAAIHVSNHGGRVLDGVPATIAVLPEIVKAVGGRVPVIVDGGIRRGVDVLRALAVGATAVAVGRPLWYCSAVGGARGVQSGLEFLRDELRVAMLGTGTRTLADISPDLLHS